MAFMDYQRPQGVDWQGATNNLINIAQAADQKQLNDLKMKQAENELAMQKKAMDTQGKVDDVKNQLTNLKPSEAVNNPDGSYTPAVTQQDVDTKKQSLLQQWATYDPNGASNYLKVIDGMDDMAQKQLLKKSERVFTHINSVLDDKGNLIDAKYNARAADYGLPKIGDTLPDGTVVSGASVMQELSQAKMMVGGVKEYINSRQKLADEKEIEGVKNTNRLAQIEQEGKNSRAVAGIHVIASNYATDKNAELFINGYKGVKGDGIGEERKRLTTLIKESYGPAKEKYIKELENLNKQNPNSGTMSQGESWKNYK